MSRGLHLGCVLLAASLFCLSLVVQARAEQEFGALGVSGYADFRLIAPPGETAWLNGGLSKFRYGDHAGNFRFAEAVLQGDYRVSDDFSAVLVLRGEPEQRTGI